MKGFLEMKPNPKFDINNRNQWPASMMEQAGNPKPLSRPPLSHETQKILTDLLRYGRKFSACEKAMHGKTIRFLALRNAQVASLKEGELTQFLDVEFKKCMGCENYD